MPLGFMSLFKKWNHILITGAFFSIIVEVAQYIGGYELAELDDAICNTLGVIIGFWF